MHELAHVILDHPAKGLKKDGTFPAEENPEFESEACALAERIKAHYLEGKEEQKTTTCTL